MQQNGLSPAISRHASDADRCCQQEVWNELWGMSGGVTPPCTSDPCIGGHYMALYNASAVAIKAVDPSLKVGGPATERECGIGWLRL